MPKKKKKKEVVKTEEDLYLERLSAFVESKLKKEVWRAEDKARKLAKKKLTKKEKFKLHFQRMYQLKQAVDAMRKQLIEEEEKRREEKRLAAIEKDKLVRYENEIRTEELTKACQRITDLEDAFLEAERINMDNQEWREYTKCNGLPNPAESGDVRTYLHVWDINKDSDTLEDSCARTKQVIELLEILRRFKDNQTSTLEQHRTWFELECEFKKFQKWNLDHACYMVLRHIEERMNRESIKIATFIHEDPHFTMCIWVLINLPIPLYDPKKARKKREELKFPEIQMEVLFPDNLDVWAQCVRAMYLTYDHFSSTSKSYVNPEPCDLHYMNLLESTEIEFEERRKISEANALLLEDVPEDITMPPLPCDAEAQDDITKTTSYMYINQEDVIYQEMKSSWEHEENTNEINLRKYGIVGGVYVLELLYQPPQPETMVLQDISLTTLIIPKWLSQVPFKSETHSLTPTRKSSTLLIPQRQSQTGKQQRGSTSSLKAEHQSIIIPQESVGQLLMSQHQSLIMAHESNIGFQQTRKSRQSQILLDEEEAKIYIYIEIILHSTILWLDKPIICSWDDEDKIWTTKYITNAAFDEDEQKISFRTSRFGVYSVAINKYCCMPFRYWKMRPNPDGSILLQVVTSINLIIKLAVNGSKVCLQDVQNLFSGKKKALKDIMGKYHELGTFRNILIGKGIDLFPNIDAACYIDDICEKHWALERHVYYQMAQCCMYFKFTRSKWNRESIRRNIVMRIREWFRNERLYLSLTDSVPVFTCLITPLRANFVDCTEEDKKFSDEPLPKMKFYPDLMNLLVDTQNLDSRKKMPSTPVDLINTVAQLLISIRPLTVS